jgi:HPt (histidine-containing phosphotransfer) domain-containing protein
MDQLPVLDKSVLQGLLRFGTAAFIVKMIDLFLETTVKPVDALETGSGRFDWPAVSFSSHSLKSSTGNLGLPRLTGLLQRIEVASRTGMHEEASLLVSQVRPLWEESCRALLEFRESFGEG